MFRKLFAVATFTALLISLALGAFAAGNLALTATASADSQIYGAASYANDGDPGTRWGGANNPGWVQFDWSTPQTFKSISVDYYRASWQVGPYPIEVWNSATSSWDSIGPILGSDGIDSPPFNYVRTLDFAPVTTTKLRVHAVTTWEIGVYNNNVEGHVTTTGGRPVGGITITATGTATTTTTTDAAGYYSMSVDPGIYDFAASKGAQYASRDDVTIGGGLTAVNFDVPTYNLATTGTATASTTDGGNVPANGNDESTATMWQSTSGDTNRWYQIEWDTPQDFNIVKLWIFNNLTDPDTMVTVSYWDSGASSFQYLASWGDWMMPLESLITLPVSLPAPTTKIRITDVKALVDVALHKSAQVMGFAFGAGGATLGCATIEGGFTTVQTDSAGFYAVDAPIGDITLRASAEGYLNLVQPVTVTNDGAYQDLNMTRLPGDLVALATSATGGFLPEGLIDAQPCTTWQALETMANGQDGIWDGAPIVIEWPSPQTIDTVIARQGRGCAMDIDVWKNGSWLWVAHDGIRVSDAGTRTELSFSPQVTTKVRIRHLYFCSSIEAYNRNGAAAVENVTGRVLSGRTGEGLANALVTAGSASCYTTEDGHYYLSLPAGGATLNITRPGYDDATRTITVPGTAPDITMATLNIAPLATATASSFWQLNAVPGATVPEYGNDDSYDTRYAAGYGDASPWYQLEWPNAVTIDKVRLHQLSDPGGAWGMTWMAVDCWNGSAWVEARRVDGLAMPTWVIDASFYPVTTTKVRLRGIANFWDVEVLTSTTTVTNGDIPTVRDLPNDAGVVTTGTLTALWDDCGYIENPSRTSGIRVQPASKFITGSSDNLAATALASADSEIYGAAGYVNDGNTGTRWGGANNPGWVELDWASPQTFNKLVIDYYRASWQVGPYQVKIWDDTTNDWKSIGTTPGSDGVDVAPVNYLRTFRFPTVTTTKLRMWGVTIWELGVYREAESPIGMKVNVTGLISTVGKERVINVDSASVEGTQLVAPLAVNGKALSTEQGKLSTIGLLVTSTGRVTKSTLGNVYVDDGSGLPSDSQGATGFKSTAAAIQNEYVSVTGIAGAMDVDGVTVRTIRPRSAGDLVKTVSSGTNLAPLGIASALAEAGGLEAFKGNDGDMATRFSHIGGGTGYWYEIDWPTAQTFNQVMMYNFCASWNSGPYSVQIWNGTDWADVTTFVTQFPPYPDGNPMYSAPYGTAVPAVASFPTVTTTKLRVQSTVTFFELEVYNF